MGASACVTTKKPAASERYCSEFVLFGAFIAQTLRAPQIAPLTEPELALKPLPLLINEGDESNWSVADVSGNLCEIVEGSLGFGIENLKAPKSGQTICLRPTREATLGNRWRHEDLPNRTIYLIF
jgi:hypothetical protein